MNAEAIINIDTGKVKDLAKYSGQYVAISVKSEVIGSGKTYKEAMKSAGNRRDFALFAIPNIKLGIAPVAS